MLKLIYLCAAVLIFLFALPSDAIEHELRRLDQEQQIKKKFWPSRLGNKEDRKCAKCEEKEAQDRFGYLQRALTSKESKEYKKELLVTLLADEKFAKKCWEPLLSKQIEVFFTVTKTGKAEDFKSFPKKVTARCLKKRVNNLDFPQPADAHYAWLVVSELVDN